MNTTQYLPIEWDAHLAQYTVEAMIDGDREELVFSSLKEAQNFTTKYAAYEAGIISEAELF